MVEPALSLQQTPQLGFKCPPHSHAKGTQYTQYYPAMKSDEFESVIVMWMDLEPVTQSKVRKRKINIIY